MMHRRSFLGAVALVPLWPKLMEAQVPAHSIFRFEPLESLQRYAELSQSTGTLQDLNARLAALAAEDPVGFWLATLAAVPPGTQEDPVERTKQTATLAEEMWGKLLPEDVQRIRHVHERAGDYPVDSYELSMKLANHWDQWFEAETFFDEIEAISSNMLPITPRPPYESWSTWRIIAQQISYALGYAGHRPPEVEGKASDAAAMLPYLFQREYDQSTVIARRFETSRIDGTLLMAWLYDPNIEVYLAYGPLPEAVPESVASISPRLAKAYAALNTRQMEEFAKQEGEMEDGEFPE